MTSGTTRGQEKRGRHLVPDLQLYHASALTHFEQCVLPEKRPLRVLSLIPDPETQPHSSLTQMAEWVMRELGSLDSRYFIDADGIHLEAFAAAVTHAQETSEPVCVLAITSALVAFFRLVRYQSENLCAAPPAAALWIRAAIRAKVGRCRARAICSRAGNTSRVAGYYCVNEYGMTEMASQFYDHVLYNRFRKSNEPRYKIGPVWTRTLVVHPETLEEVPPGEHGILRHFDLANCGSVMAIQTDDVGYLPGDGFEIIGRTPGSEARGCALVLDEFLSAQ